MPVDNTFPNFSHAPTGAISPVGFDRTRRLAWWDVQRTESNQTLGPSTDPTNSHWLHHLHLHNEFQLYYGRVVDTVVYTNCYKIQSEHGKATLWCTALTNTALQPMGAKQFGQIAIGAAVIFTLHPTDSFGIILGVIPEFQTHSAGTAVDFISQQARCGLLVDPAHGYPLTLNDNGFVIDFSAGRPLDQTGAGESGNITEMGLMNFIDSFMTVSRVDEECGLWTFFHDQLTRLSGHNLQLWSAGTEREDLDDEGEFDVVQGYTPYYWEALGAFDFDVPLCRAYDAGCWQKNPNFQAYSANEPCVDNQQAFYRLRDFYGYLGQAHKRVLCLPPPIASSSSSSLASLFGDDLGSSSPLTGEVSSDDATCGSETCTPVRLNQLPDQTIYPGVFEENLALTGRYCVRTAHEYIISKHICIPAPKLIARPEDPNADNATNYKAASILGGGPNHLVEGEIENPGPDDPLQIQAAGFLDTHAFVFNWIGDHPFHYHELDWYLPDEDGLNYLQQNGGIAFVPPFFDELACHQFLRVPDAIPIKVDHRYDKVNYYPNHSYIALLATGGVVIGDGFGTEFKMANGSFWLTCPGDGMIQTGRDMITFAGYDVVLRAKNSWDISATNRDGRLKAHNNLFLLSSGTCGGVLIESKAARFAKDTAAKGEEAVIAGIVIKTDTSLLSLCAKDMCFKLNTTLDDGFDRVIVFDVGAKGRLKFAGKFMERFFTEDGAALDTWGGIDSAEWWKGDVRINAKVGINDDLIVNGCGVFGDALSVAHGHIFTSNTKTFKGKVGFLTPADVAIADDDFDLMDQNQSELEAIMDEELINLIQRQEAYTGCDMDFSFRTVPQYKTKNYVLFENRWQQFARVSGTATNPWFEEEYNDTYPYPGKENYEGEAYRTLDLKLFDITTGLATARGSIYETPIFFSPNTGSLQTDYLVII